MAPKETQMTTMAEVGPPLRRLFDRLDFAPNPVEAALASALASWARLRGANAAPRWPMPTKDLGAASAVFLREAGRRDYVLAWKGAAFDALSGPLQTEAELSSAPRRREAVRLRRLLDHVIEKGEPLLASFKTETDGGGVVSVVAAPVADAEGRLCGALVSHRTRLVTSEASPRHAGPSDQRPMLFSLGGSGALAAEIAARLDIDVAPHEERDFEDGEHKIRPLAEVRNRDVYVVADLASSPGQGVNDKLCKLLFFLGSLKQSGARGTTLVAPYLCYARKERQTRPRDPVVTRYVAQVLEAVGLDRIVSVSAHDLAAFQNAFRIDAIHLDTHALLARALTGRLAGRRVAVASPDPGGEKRAELFRQALERILGEPVTKALVDKTRSRGKVSGQLFAGDVEGRTALILDDMIATGGTMIRAAEACLAHGAAEAIAVATHGLFAGGAEALLGAPSVAEIWVTDSLAFSPAIAAAVSRGRVKVAPLAPLLSAVIACCHSDGSIDDLLEHET
jgi:ribose-phosphate pyrophosphokinase